MTSRNPPKRPEVLPGKQAVWVKRARSVVRVSFIRKGRKRYKLVVRERKAHYRIIPISVKATKARSRGSFWIPAQAYARELDGEWDLSGADVIYRYKPMEDVIRSLSPSDDPLHNLVWDKPFNADEIRGEFQALRVWYIVHNTNLNLYYLYVRTAQLGSRVAGSLQSAKDYVDRLADEIRYEYDEKIYMEFDRVVAWTAYRKAKVKARHKRRVLFSQEKGFDFNERTWKMFRVTTPWEKKMIMKASEGGEDPRIPDVFRRRYGGNYKRFADAMRRLPPGLRRQADDYMKWAMGRMEKALDARRGKRT